jgi:8-oxo-dGTP pyrophosphatase MutT (NUDIX family)
VVSDARVRVAVQCVFRRAGRVLLFEQEFRRSGRRAWRAVGGGVEPGESLEEALRREIREELGREIDDPRLLGSLRASTPWWGAEPEHVIHVFDAGLPGSEELEAIEGTDADGTIIAARWMSLDEAAALDVVPVGLLDLLRSTP